jgi:hypothetical protein
MIKEISKLNVSQKAKEELMRAKNNGIRSLLIEIQDDFEFDTATRYFSEPVLYELGGLNPTQTRGVVKWLRDRAKFFNSKR